LANFVSISSLAAAKRSISAATASRVSPAAEVPRIPCVAEETSGQAG